MIEIKLSKLDKEKTYIGLQYDTKSFVTKQIVKFSKNYAPNSKEIPCHVLMLKYHSQKWWVYESHINGKTEKGMPAGVRRYPLQKWEQIEKKHKDGFKFYELELNRNAMEEYIGYNYGVGDIKALFKAWLCKNNGKQKDYKGYICSEYFALCHNKICEYYKLPPHCITPAHIQRYLEESR